uniref:Ovule protein n=1 Tax=Panagrellus redivivus TaxID=6233 RepID=A0A7E4W5H7_PANRE
MLSFVCDKLGFGQIDLRGEHFLYDTQLGPSSHDRATINLHKMVYRMLFYHSAQVTIPTHCFLDCAVLYNPN